MIISPSPSVSDKATISTSDGPLRLLSHTLGSCEERSEGFSDLVSTWERL